MQPRPRRIRDELLAHGWWLVPLVLLLWFRQLELPAPEPGPALDESRHAVKGWELLTIVRLGIDSVSGSGRLGWFHGAPELAQLFWWKYWGFEIGLKLALCALCAHSVLRTRGRLARLLFALALLALPASLDALALVSLLALFQHVLGAGERHARGELAGLAAGALLAQVEFGYFLVWAAGLALGFAALWTDVSLRRACAFLLRGAGAFLFLWVAFGQSPAHFPDWLRTSWWIASGCNEAVSAAGPARELLLSLAMLALLLLVLGIEFARSERGARPRALLVLALAAGLFAWRSTFTRAIGDSDLFFSVAPAAACFALEPRALPGRAQAIAAGTLRALLLCAGAFGLARAPAQLDPAHAAQTLRDLVDPVGLRQRTSTRGAELAAEWDLPRVRATALEETLDVFQNSQGVAFLNGLNFHPRPVFQSWSACTPELLELNRAFYEGERAPVFALYRIEPIDGRLAPAEDAKAFDELLLRYRPCFEERGWLLLQRETAPVRTQASTTLAARSVALGEWIELADLPDDALELRLDARASARGRLAALLLRGPALACEFERADGSRGRARLVPGAARAGFLVRPFVETQAQLARVFAGLPVAGLARLRVLAAEGEEGLWEPRLSARCVGREGLLPPLRETFALALQYPDFEPAPSEVACSAGMRDVQQAGRAVHVLPAPAALRWRLEPGAYRLSATYGLIDAAWQDPEASDGVLIFVVLQQGREQTQVFRRLLDPRSAPEDRGDQPLLLDFELHSAGDLYLRMRTGWNDNATRDWLFWESVKIERR